MGFLGINTPEALGGLGLTLLDALIVMEEFAKISVGVAFPVFECCTGPVRIVERLGSPELRERIVPRAAGGEMLVAVSMSEPDAGTALTDLRTRASIDGDTKIGRAHVCTPVTNAPLVCRLLLAKKKKTNI